MRTLPNRGIRTWAVSATLSILFCVAGSAQPLDIFIPRAAQDAQRSTGLAFANPSDQLALLQLQYLDENGLLLADPVDLIIPPGSQIARSLSEIFGPLAENSQGWVIGSSENISVVGFFLGFRPDLESIDGAEGLVGGQIGSDLVFPEILSGPEGSTSLTIVGFGSDSNQAIDFDLIGEDGAVIESVSRLLPPFPDLGSQIVIQADDLFAQPIPETSYVRAHGDGIGLFGFEEFGTQTAQAGRNAIRVERTAILQPSSLFGAQLAASEALSSTLTLINPTDSAASITLTATPSGTPDPDSALVAQRNLAPGALLREDAAALFAIEPASNFVGWVRVDSDITGLAGDVTFGTPDGLALSSVELQSIATDDAVFSQVAQGTISFTGITLLNPHQQATQVEIDVFRTDGVRSGQGSISLQPGEHRPRNLPELIAGFGEQAGGFIRVTSELPIYTFELFGFTIGSPPALASLSAVPPQRISGRLSGSIALPQSSPQPGDIFVAALDPATQRVQFAALADPEADLGYSLLAFSGAYEVLAGNDPDQDGLICEGDAEELCGFFPDNEGRTPVVLQAGQETADIDITLGEGIAASALRSGKTANPGVDLNGRFLRQRLVKRN